MKKAKQIFKAMSFFVVCLICNACSWLAEDPGVDVNWQNIQIMNKSGEKIYALEFMFKDSTLLTPQYTLDKYSKEEIIKQNIFDKRYELSYNELKKMNFKITYSGN